MTEPQGRSWVQTIYYPFLYTSVNGRGTALKAELDTPTYACSVGDAVPYVDCAAVLSEDGKEVILFIVNKNLEEDIRCKTCLSGLSCDSVIEWVILSGFAPDDVNTAERAGVRPKRHKGAIVTERVISFTLPKASWNMLRLRLR